MNFSKVVTLPKAFTDNYLDESGTVEMSLSSDGRLVLTPVTAAGNHEVKGGQK